MTESKTVYIVDDNEAVLEYNISQFEGAGFVVVGSSKSPLKAKKEIEKLSPRYICLDIIMPDMDGIELYRYFKKLKKNFQFMFASALSSEAKFIANFEKEIDPFRFLQKPILEETIEDFLLNLDASGKKLPAIPKPEPKVV